MILSYDQDKKVANMMTRNLTEIHLPIDLTNILADEYNIDVLYDDLHGENGYIFRNTITNRYLICINNKDTLGRQRFTLAHEIAHILLGHFDNFDLDNPVDHEVLDKHANVCASNLLMPNHILARFEHFSTEYIAKAFNVSHSALAVRLQYCDIEVI